MATADDGNEMAPGTEPTEPGNSGTADGTGGRTRARAGRADRARNAPTLGGGSAGGNSDNSGNRRGPKVPEGAVKQTLPAHVTGAAAQAAHAQALYQQSLQSQYAPLPTSLQPDLAATIAGDPPRGVPPAAVIDAMYANQAPQEGQASMYAPGAPLRPVPGLESAEGPRGWQYPVGYNIASQPRSSEAYTFSQLRALAQYYEGIQICERVWFDVVSRLEPHVTFKPNTIPDGESEADPKWRKITDPVTAFIEQLDSDSDLSEWLTASVRDVLELGLSTVYYERNRVGEVTGLNAVDPATVKILIDERGRLPRPPFPAFQQFPYGTPGGQYTRDQMELVRETTRSDSIYPLSRVEAVIYRVNMALRKQSRDMARFTDGNIPAGIIFPPAPGQGQEMSSEDWEQWTKRWDALLAGQDRMRARVRLGPEGATYVKTDPDDPLLSFDEYMLKVTVAAFGLTMDEIAFTATSNRSVGQTQEAVIYRRVVQPLATRYGRILTRIARQKFNDPRLLVTWGGFTEPEDEQAKANTLRLGVQAGAISPSYMARKMGWPVNVEVPPFVMTKDGPIPLEQALNLRKAQMDSGQAAIQFPVGAPDSTSQLPPALVAEAQSAAQAGEETNAGQAAAANVAAQAKPGTAAPTASAKSPAPAKTPAPTSTGTQSATDKADAAKQDHVDGAEVAPELRPKVARVLVPAAAATAIENDPEAVRAEYKRWRVVADRAVRDGRRMPAFHTELIPLEEYALLAADLAGCRSKDTVREAFERARERERRPVPVGRVPQSLHSAHVAHSTLQAPAGVQHARTALTANARHIFDDVARRAAQLPLGG